MERTRFFRRPVVWIVLVIIGAIALSSLFTSGQTYTPVNTSDVLAQLDSGNVHKVLIEDKEQTVDLDLKTTATFNGTSTNKIKAQIPYLSVDRVFKEITDARSAGKIDGTVDTKVTKDSVLLGLLVNLLPIAVLVILLLLFMSQMQGGGSRVLNFGKSKAKLISKDTPKTTFADVAGADEAVEELHEIKDFLQNPAKYQALGAKIPKGVLLFGPPGTGKTLLARAVAGEAGVPFYSISGSDFVEMFVGVGASRVRDLFEQAKANAPAIVFVDEIDAVGRHRGAGLGGGHDEREQTLNQLLVEMDGFDTKGGVILIAATNRPDILDPALLRPGRFDRQIAVDTPDMEGRKAILRVHAKGKPFTPDVDLDAVARRTPGFTGADLANVVNESALLTARNEKRAITNDFLEEAIDRVIAGPQRRTRVMSDHEKKITAYHEGGHALVAWALPHSAPVHKVTILSRGRSLGHTLVLPTEDKYTQTRAEMIDTLAYALGGRAAEELVFHEPTTGAGNDIEKATAIARAMVTEYGMSSKLGAVKYGVTDGEPFLGRTMGHTRDYSDSVAADIDSEVRSLIELAHDEAWEILVEYRDILDSIVLELIEKETISQADMARIAARVVKRPPMAPYNGFGKRQPSDQPPVLTPTEKDKLKAQAESDGVEALSGGGSDGSR
ncbi:MAG: cell division protein FtsH [Actinobacteria bacterium 13_1_20CM_3_71_11]|nr:MAG: cell division protein FtsH [Actinobacteria bacterium 13_1_20CM_3_71_11]TML30917.1 MAG: ATP-dependent metallopeptidase FtsH/Yme1/Tma family protein [Actinomycetota bacterium]